MTTGYVKVKECKTPLKDITHILISIAETKMEWSHQRMDMLS